MFLYKVLISHEASRDREFVVYHHSEKKLPKAALTKTLEAQYHSSQTGYKVVEIKEISLS
jgi:hypothetical protein